MRYEPAANPPKAKGCQSGTLALALAIKDTWRPLQSLTNIYGCFNPRRIAGSKSWSLHAEGRAIDIGVPAEFNQLGWELACHLVDRRALYGTMRVLWDKHIWSTEKPAEWRRLSATTGQHRDHIHVEQFWSHASKPTSMRETYKKTLAAARLKK